eukprot:10229976-Heterocapsa_arctica.AAC.1
MDSALRRPAGEGDEAADREAPGVGCSGNDAALRGEWHVRGLREHQAREERWGEGAVSDRSIGKQPADMV